LYQEIGVSRIVVTHISVPTAPPKLSSRQSAATRDLRLLFGFQSITAKISRVQAAEGYGLQPVHKNIANEAAFTQQKEVEGAAAFRLLTECLMNDWAFRPGKTPPMKRPSGPEGMQSIPATSFERARLQPCRQPHILEIKKSTRQSRDQTCRSSHPGLICLLSNNASAKFQSMKPR